MSFLVKNIIFDLFGNYDNRKDINKDGAGKGTYQRYNEIVGEDIDTEIKDQVDSIVGYNVVPSSVYEKFIPYREIDGGVDLVLGKSVEMRRKVLAMYPRFVAIKGTIKCFTLLFKMLGFDSTVTPTFQYYTLDSPLTFDDPERIFDMGCNGCIKYTIELFGAVSVTPEINDAIQSIIKFNQPINAELASLTLNEGHLVQEIISVEIDDNGDLIYNNEYDPSLVLTLDGGSLKVEGDNASHYSINENGDLIYTV